MNIKFYPGDGEIPILEYLKKLAENKHTEKQSKKILSKIEKLEKHGLAKMLKAREVRKIQGRGYEDVYEIKVNYQGAHRLFFVVCAEDYWFLHIILKKSQKTPKPALNLVLQRKEEIKSNFY